MLLRLTLALAVSVVVGIPRIAAADPITYDFTGTLQQPIDGTTTFSGALTINGTPTEQGPPGDLVRMVTEGGSDVSLSLNLGGQVFNIVNSTQNPFTYVAFSAEGQDPSYSPPDVLMSLWGAFNPSKAAQPVLDVYSTFYAFGTTLPDNLATLNPSPNGSYFSLQTDSPGSLNSTGTFGQYTSFDLVSTPEPSTLAIFAGLGTAALLHRRRSVRRD